MVTKFASSASALLGPNAHAPMLQPIVFCGHGNNLYPLCSSPTSAPSLSSPDPTSSSALPKALLPILNRPMIAYPLQQILSAGLRHVIILAPSEQHQLIAAALKTLILVPPVALAQGKRATSAAAAAAAVQEASKHPNLSVTVGLSSTSNAVATSTSAATGAYLSSGSIPSIPSSSSSSSNDSSVMRIDLLPLGPDDVSGKGADASVAAQAPGGKRSRRMGTAPLLSWLHSIGRLVRDPLIVPIDFLGQGVSLTTLINSHIAGVPDSPMMTTLMYERGAGEGTGKEREKDGPPKLFTVYDRSPLSSSSSSSSSSHSLHRLLLLQDSDDISDLDASDLHVRMSLLWSHPHIRISTSLLDSHIYIFNLRKLIGLLQSKDGQRMKSLKEEVVPFIAKCSWMKGLREKAGWQSDTSAAEKTSRSSSLIPGQMGGSSTGGNGGAGTQSYVPWTMQASREEVGAVRRSTTFVEPELLDGRSADANLALGTAQAIDGQANLSRGDLLPGGQGVGTRSSPLFTPELSRAPSPRSREAMLRSFTPVDPSSPAIELGRPDMTQAVGARLDTTQKAQLKAIARRSAAEVRAVTLIVRLAGELNHPIDPSLTIEQVRQAELDESASKHQQLGGVAAQQERFVARANTVPTYIECNRYLLRSLTTAAASSSASTLHSAAGTMPVAVLPETLPHPLPLQAISTAPSSLLAGTSAPPVAQSGSAASDSGSTGTPSAAAGGAEAQLIDPKAQVSTDSVVAEHTRIGERAMIKRSVVGRGCVVARNAKVTGCIIMDGVRIGDGAKLENCILCPSSVVEDRANLKDCDVAANVRVPNGTNSKNEKFDE